MHLICYALLSAIHFAASGFAVLAGVMPEAACAALAASVYVTLALAEWRG